ncbi:MAG TPA: ABC transporter permease [Geminicoccus sp.]|jgi:ribose transport system permease protein|uniref:ABC transporter permease n=1 Tax=Geminicoccus sp. TaxID=2024832 RepID=UPI002E31873B|nr:ABC transporter permease [Geminicoccus sp.]HEX2527910.1 ABC transporter permease [Geminicoccus sp.]
MKGLLRHRVTLGWLVVVALWIAAGLLKPGFARIGHLRYLLELASITGIVAAGQTLVVIGGGIDLSVAAVITFSAIVLPLLTFGFDPTGLSAVLLTLGIATAIGGLNGIGVVLLRVHPLILTLATATILQGALILIAGGSAVSVDNPAVTFLGNGQVLGLPMTILTWLMVAAVTLLVLHGTVLGSWLFALGTNDRAAMLAGVPGGKAAIAVHAASGFCAGLAGLLLLGMNRQGYVGIGEPYLLGSIAAVVLGGTSILGGRGTYLGTIAGSILLVTITALITVVNASPGWRAILFGGLILGLLLVSGRERAL